MTAGNSFGTEKMASGYATSRPPVHLLVMTLARESLGWSKRVARALDVGCGVGLSTKALTGMANECIGIDPAAEMLKWSATVAPEAFFAAGAAEALPIRDRSVDLITAAGSLNYADLDLFFPEAARVLQPAGVLLVYDFEPGRSFAHTSQLDEWFECFIDKYPMPASEGRSLSPEILARMDSGFRTQTFQHFETGIELTPQFYVEYMLTETNVAAALRTGTPVEEIRSWCSKTLKPIWSAAVEEVLFRGYFVCMKKARG